VTSNALTSNPFSVTRNVSPTPLFSDTGMDSDLGGVAEVNAGVEDATGRAGGSRTQVGARVQLRGMQCDH
jgi:hypothetical protein